MNHNILLSSARHGWKFVAAWLICLGIRLIPFRVPNVEPILAANMPFAEKYGPYVGASFGMLSIIAFDVITRTFGTWTFFTVAGYGIVGAYASYALRKNNGRIGGYFMTGIIGTLLFDAITGLLPGPLLFNQTFLEAFLGQIPFTAYHLLGTMFFSLTLSPLLRRWIVENPALEQRLARA